LYGTNNNYQKEPKAFFPGSIFYIISDGYEESGNVTCEEL
jgi:hypothetical protein